MDKLNAIYIQQMVDVAQRDIERLGARQQRFAAVPKKPGFIARSRRAIGASFVGAGKLIQGRPKPETTADPSASSKGALNLIP